MKKLLLTLILPQVGLEMKDLIIALELDRPASGIEAPGWKLTSDHRN